MRCWCLTTQTIRAREPVWNMMLSIFCFTVKISQLFPKRGSEFTVESWRWEEQRYCTQRCLLLRKSRNVLLLHPLSWVVRASPAGPLLIFNKGKQARSLNEDFYQNCFWCIYFSVQILKIFIVLIMETL